MKPTFTVIIGSICRPQLKHALDSIKRQGLIPGDQAIVAIDAFEQGERLDTQEFVRSYGPEFIAVAHVGINTETETKVMPDGRTAAPGQPYHWLGVEQINHALRTIPITGSHVFTIGDDDVFVDGAYNTLRAVCEAHPLSPIIYKFIAPNRWVLWDKPRMRPCLISGCCIAAPYPYVDLMHTRIETTHDYDWMMAVIGKAGLDGHEPLWLDYVGVVARPEVRDGEPRHGAIWQCWHCRQWKYRGEMPIAKTHCECGVLIDLNTVSRIVDAVDPIEVNAYH